MSSKKPEIKYKRPVNVKFAMGVSSRCVDFADVIEKHLKIRLKEETEWLRDCCRKQANEQYVDWFMHTEKFNNTLITREVARLNRGRKEPIDFYSKEGKSIIGKSLLDKFVALKRNDVINLRKALGLEYRKYSNKNVILTNGIEHSDIFRLFGSPLCIEDLKANYKKLAKECHPDIASGSEDLMARVSGLYKMLLETWDKYNPSNLAIEDQDFNEVANNKLKDPGMAALLDFF